MTLTIASAAASAPPPSPRAGRTRSGERSPRGLLARARSAERSRSRRSPSPGRGLPYLKIDIAYDIHIPRISFIMCSGPQYSLSLWRARGDRVADRAQTPGGAAGRSPGRRNLGSAAYVRGRTLSGASSHGP